MFGRDEELIAVVGMSAILPSGENLNENWESIRAGIDFIKDLPPDRVDVTAYYHPDKTKKDAIYCKRGGFIPDFEFDAREFGLNMLQMEDCDTNQTLTLLKVKEALEDAKIEPISKEKRNIGTVIGLVGGQKASHEFYSRLNYVVLEKVLRKMGLPEQDVETAVEKYKANFPEWRLDSFPGFLSNVTAGRCANVFNLSGMNCVVDAACASSLIALKVAIDELLHGDCDTMVTGAVCTDNSLGMYMSFSKTPVFSKEQSLKAYDESSQGMLIGEGCAMFVLKRLETAKLDGDEVYAVIRSCSSSSDGKAPGIYTPTMEGQEKCIQRALSRAGVDPGTITMVEGHGTGTPVGDKLELTALKNAVSVGQRERVAVGSIKSQIGHLKAVAGAAGMVKAILALKHKTLPPTINMNNPPHPLLDGTDIRDSDIYLNTRLRPWFTDPGVPRRAGLSSFGFGGANYHCILEEYESEHTSPYRMNKTPRSVLFSSASKRELIGALESEIETLQEESHTKEFQARNGLGAKPIPETDARIGFVIPSNWEVDDVVAHMKTLVATLKQSDDCPGYADRAIGNSAQLIFAFPSEGSQVLYQSEDLALNWPPFRNTIAAMDKAAMRAKLPQRPSNVLYPRAPYGKERDTLAKEQTAMLDSNPYAKAVTMACAVGIFEIFKQSGIVPKASLGFGVAGNCSAEYANGHLSLDQAFDKVLSSEEKLLTLPCTGCAQQIVLELGAGANGNRIPDSTVVVSIPHGSETEVHQAAIDLAVLGFVPTIVFDPWGKPNPFHGRTKSQRKTNLKLSAASYVSKKTLKERNDILNDGRTVTYTQPGKSCTTCENELAKMREELRSLKKTTNESLRELEQLNHSRQELELAQRGLEQELRALKLEQQAFPPVRGMNGKLELEFLERQRNALSKVLQEF